MRLFIQGPINYEFLAFLLESSKARYKVDTDMPRLFATSFAVYPLLSLNFAVASLEEEMPLG